MDGCRLLFPGESALAFVKRTCYLFDLTTEKPYLNIMTVAKRDSVAGPIVRWS